VGKNKWDGELFMETSDDRSILVKRLSKSLTGVIASLSVFSCGFAAIVLIFGDGNTKDTFALDDGSKTIHHSDNEHPISEGLDILIDCDSLKKEHKQGKLFKLFCVDSLEMRYGQLRLVTSPYDSHKTGYKRGQLPTLSHDDGLKMNVFILLCFLATLPLVPFMCFFISFLILRSRGWELVNKGNHEVKIDDTIRTKNTPRIAKSETEDFYTKKGEYNKKELESIPKEVSGNNLNK